jgi:hypothetical protein
LWSRMGTRGRHSGRHTRRAGRHVARRHNTNGPPTQLPAYTAQAASSRQHAHTHARTRATFASTSAWLQGGVRPKWLQGSSVT